MPTFEMQRAVSAPRGLVWSVISDLERYADVAPNLSKVHVVEGEGVGLTRRCYNEGGRGWSETCTLWEEGHRYSMAVDTSDYPYPLRKMEGTWTVDDHPDGSVITMRFDYEWKLGPMGWLMDQLYARRTFRSVCSELLDNWERLLEDRLDGGAEASPSRENA